MKPTAKQYSQAAKAIQKRHRIESAAIRRKLRDALRAIRRAKPEFLRASVEALAATLRERRAMAIRHRQEREQLRLEVLEARAGLRQAKADWPRVKEQRAAAIKAFAAGDVGAKLAQARATADDSRLWLADAKNAAQQRRRAAEVKRWGKRKSATAILNAAKAKGQRPAEAREQAQNAAEWQISTMYPRKVSLWHAWVKQWKPFSETARREWLKTANPRFSNPDYWGERVVETFLESAEGSELDSEEVTYDEFARLEREAWEARSEKEQRQAPPEYETLALDDDFYF